MIESHRGRPLPADVDSYPLDVSPYGVCGMAGNMRDWCADLFTSDGPATLDHWVSAPLSNTTDDDTTSRAFRALRGGAWGSLARYARCANRDRFEPGFRNASFGFRVALAPASTLELDP